MIYDKSIFSRGILCLFYIYYYVIHSLCISVSLLNTENSSVKHTLPGPKKKKKKVTLIFCWTVLALMTAHIHCSIISLCNVTTLISI